MKFRITIFIVLLSMFHTSCFLAMKRSRKINQQLRLHPQTYDVAIVPGVPLKNGAWDSIMKSRVLWSVYLYQQHIIKNIIYSGSAVYSPYYEAISMGLYAQQLGVPPAHIFYDTLALHSTENVYYSYLIAQKNHFKSIALVTDPFQSILLRRFTKKRFKTPIKHLPIDYNIIQKTNYLNPIINAEIAYKKGFTSILQTQSFRKRWRGTRGKNIQFGKKRKLSAL